MQHGADRDLTRTDALTPATGGGGGVPGKSTLTARLWRRTGPDPRGVGPGAEAAVDRLGGGGAPLPGGVRDQFEASLGADLGAVRVHTDEASAGAADAVGARAFARGSDIHFAAGQYQPDDPFGMHLLAHEVAHTVQQSGAAPTTQHKLTVSAPGDAAEVEADRAADAMVAGRPAGALISGGGAGLMRAPAVQAPAVAPTGKIEHELSVYKGKLACFAGELKVVFDLTSKPVDPAAAQPVGQLKSGSPGVAIEHEETKQLVTDVDMSNKESFEVGATKGKLGKLVAFKTPFGPVNIKAEGGFDIVKWEAGKPPKFAVVSLAGGVEIPLKEVTLGGKKYKVAGTVKIKGEAMPDPEKVAEWVAKSVTTRLATMGIGSLGFLAGAILVPIGAFIGGLIGWAKAGHELDEGERWIQSATGYARAYVNVLKGLPPLDNINAGSSGLIAAMNGAKDGRKQLEEHAEKLGLPLEAIPTHLPAGHEIYASVWASSWKQIKPAWLDHPKVKGDKVLERTVEAFGTGPYSRWHG